MMSAVAETQGRLDETLSSLVREAAHQAPDILSAAVIDGRGLPVINAMKAGAAITTFSAMVTMSARAADSAVRNIGLAAAEHLLVHTELGDLLVLNVLAGKAYLAAILKTDANLGYTLIVLRSLASQLAKVLGDYLQ